MQPAVYILTNRRNGTLYVGSTANLPQRIWQHREGVVEGFTKRYGTKQLVWYELFDEMAHAIARELAIKEWKRAWKLELIAKFNPSWRDLYSSIL